MESSPLRSLPTELIFWVLNFMEPHEYSGFPCTCREAAALVNRKLDNAKDQKEIYLGFGSLLDDNEALRAQLLPWKSRTARYVDKEREWFQLAVARYREDMQESARFHRLSDDDDQDL